MRIPALLLTLACMSGAELVPDGVLGNSGGEGQALVRHGVQPARGLGPVLDRWGGLWDRAGKGTLVRCTADGRMLGGYRIPDREHHYTDRAAIAGDRLVMLLRNELWVLPLDAPPGSEATPLKQNADALAPTARDGQVLVGDAQGLAWLDPATGARTPAGPGFKDLGDLEVGADGTIYAVASWKVQAIRDGRPLGDGWPKASPGEKPQLIDGHWYGHAWHSTVKRHDAALAPAPGVVLGGNSGSFIGHVDENPDIINGRGLVRLPEGGWALGNHAGGISLLSWDGARRQFAVTRRIGALPRVPALAVDGQGRVTLGHGWWTWDDTPDAPLREGPGISNGQLFQLAPLGGGRLVSLGLQYGNHPRIAAGTPAGWRFTAGQEQGIQVAKDTTGVAALAAKGGYTLVAVTGAGQASAIAIDAEGRCRDKQVAVALTLAEPAPKAWTSLAADGQGNLLAAADGQVLVLAPADGGWTETRRWNGWDGDAFGAAIWIQTDGGRLWVSDRDKHRVLCFDRAGGKPIAIFGGTKGDDAGHLDAPQAIAASGDRCVVHDAGNQRLLKLRLR